MRLMYIPEILLQYQMSAKTILMSYVTILGKGILKFVWVLLLYISGNLWFNAILQTFSWYYQEWSVLYVL